MASFSPRPVGSAKIPLDGQQHYDPLTWRTSAFIQDGLCHTNDLPHHPLSIPVCPRTFSHTEPIRVTFRGLEALRMTRFLKCAASSLTHLIGGTYSAAPVEKLCRREVCHVRPRLAQPPIVADILRDDWHAHKSIPRIHSLSHLALPVMQKNKMRYRTDLCPMESLTQQPVVSHNGQGIYPPLYRRHNIGIPSRACSCPFSLKSTCSALTVVWSSILRLGGRLLYCDHTTTCVVAARQPHPGPKACDNHDAS